MVIKTQVKSVQQKTFKRDYSGGVLSDDLTGTIKSFGYSKNYGFIDCPELKAQGYGDIFLHGDEKRAYEEGQTVKFSAILNKEGKPAAVKLRSGLGKRGGTDQLELLLDLLGGGGKGGRWCGQQKTFKRDDSGGVLGDDLTGTIKSFGYSKNYGFIDCPELKAQGHGDIFLHGDEKRAYKEGQTVKFSAILNQEGKPVAVKLRSGLK